MLQTSEKNLYTSIKQPSIRNELCRRHKNWDEWLIQQMIVLSFRVTSTDWRKMPAETSRSSTKSCIWEAINSYTSMDRLVAYQVVRGLAEKALEPGGHQVKMHTLATKRGNNHWAVVSTALPGGQRRLPLSSTRHSVSRVLSTVLGSPRGTRHGHTWMSPAKDDKDD